MNSNFEYYRIFYYVAKYGNLTFERIKPVLSTDGYEPQMEPVPLSEVDETKRRLENLPKEIPFINIYLQAVHSSLRESRILAIYGH